MYNKARFKDPYFISVLIIILGIIYLALTNYLEWWDLHLRIGPIFIHHWFSITGASFIATFAPAYRILKRRRPKSYRTLIRIHIFGNLFAAMLISVHFGHHMHRPWAILPDLRSGIALYATVSLLIATGILQRFQFAPRLRKSWRLIHLASTVTFYIVITIHLLQRLGVI